MFLNSVVLYSCLTTIFAESFLTNINEGNPRFVPQQESSSIQGDQAYAPSISQLPMEGNQPIYPIPQQSMMQQPMMPLPMMPLPMMPLPMMRLPMMPLPMMPMPMMPLSMMQGFQSPFLMNAMNQQQLSLLLMSAYTKIMALTQLMSMQNRYQPYQPDQYSDPTVNNYGPTPLQQAQPQIDPQNNLQNEMLQQQQQQAELQHKAILEQRKVQREYEMEVERREALIKRHAEEEELEKSQKEIERQLRDEEELRREREELKKQLLEEQRKENEQKEYDLKLRQEEELRFKQIEEKKKKKQNQENMKPKMRIIKTNRKPIVKGTS